MSRWPDCRVIKACQLTQKHAAAQLVTKNTHCWCCIPHPCNPTITGASMTIPRALLLLTLLEGPVVWYDVCSAELQVPHMLKGSTSAVTDEGGCRHCIMTLRKQSYSFVSLLRPVIEALSWLICSAACAGCGLWACSMLPCIAHHMSANTRHTSMQLVCTQ